MREATKIENSNHKGSKFPRTEWDFSKVPALELDACFAWEYAREWDLLRHGNVNPPPKSIPVAGGEQLNPEFGKYIADPDQVIGCLQSEMLLTWRAHLDTPWQQLASEAKIKILATVNIEAPGLEAMDLATAASTNSTGRQERVAFNINWDHSDTRLIAEFAAWLRDCRKAPAKEQRGRNRRDDLNMLGGMRLLHHLKLEDAIIETTRARGEPLYGKRPSWERARKTALRVFQEDFLIDASRWKVMQMPHSHAKLERE